MTRDPDLWNPELERAVAELAHRPALLSQIAGELAIAGRALEELAGDVEIEPTCERLELRLHVLNGEGPDVERIRAVVDLLRYLEGKR
ncbi:MAG TPA: hypothetical protein VGF93_17055 [Solirubrobacteraceae bacterium]|jgi:hypothetical protein